MIKVTRFNQTQFYVNAEMIYMIESTPDTVINLTNEKKLVVSETPEELVKMIIEYKRQTMKLITIKRQEIG